MTTNWRAPPLFLLAWDKTKIYSTIILFQNKMLSIFLGLKITLQWTSSCRNICVNLRVISLGWIPLSGPLSRLKNSGLSNNLHSEIDLYIKKKKHLRKAIWNCQSEVWISRSKSPVSTLNWHTSQPKRKTLNTSVNLSCLTVGKHIISVQVMKYQQWW